MCNACNKMNGLGRKRKGQKKSKTMGRKRRTSRVSGLNSKDAAAVAQTYILPGIAGAVAAKYLDKLPFIKDKPEYMNYAAIVGGVLLAVATKNPMVTAAGIGMATVGGAGVVADLMDGSSTPKGLGLLPYGERALSISGFPDGVSVPAGAPGIAVR